MALEQTRAQAASPGHILLCHRGTLDALVYWMYYGWEEQEFLTATGMTWEEHLWRSTGVIHLQTTAIDAESYYCLWPDAHRPETLAQAAEIDRLCAYAWKVHPHYILIENAEQPWAAKAAFVLSVLTNWLS